MNLKKIILPAAKIQEWKTALGLVKLPTLVANYCKIAKCNLTRFATCIPVSKFNLYCKQFILWHTRFMIFLERACCKKKTFESFKRINHCSERAGLFLPFQFYWLPARWFLHTNMKKFDVICAVYLYCLVSLLSAFRLLVAGLVLTIFELCFLYFAPLFCQNCSFFKTSSTIGEYFKRNLKTLQWTIWRENEHSKSFFKSSLKSRVSLNFCVFDRSQTDHMHINLVLVLCYPKQQLQTVWGRQKLISYLLYWNWIWF